MTYKLIEKMVNNTVLLHQFPIDEDDHPDIKETLEKIKLYPGFQVAKEIIENFKENFRYPEAIKQLESDYRLYFDQIEDNIKHYEEEEQKAWRGWIKILEKQVQLKTIHILIKKPVDPRIENLATFLGFTTIDEIDKFYNKKYQTWLFRNSHSTEKLNTDPEETFILKYDLKGNIINAKFSCATKYGILLSEKDFIDSEVAILNRLEVSNLSFDDKKRIEYYKDYLNSKLTDKPGNKENNSLEDFLINITDKESFIQELKENFPIEKGKRIRAMILVLQDEEMLVFNPGELSTLIECIRISFNRDIGSYSGINIKTQNLDPITINPIKTKLNPLISKYKQTL